MLSQTAPQYKPGSEHLTRAENSSVECRQRLWSHQCYAFFFYSDPFDNLSSALISISERLNVLQSKQRWIFLYYSVWPTVYLFFLYFSRDCILHLYIYKPWVREVALACLIYSRSPTESRTRWGITTRRRMWKLLIISYANVWKHLKLNSSIHRYVFFFSPINSSTLEWSCEDTMCYGTRWKCMGRSLSSYTWKIRFVLELILP